MANTSISLINLDFDTLKASFKEYLKSQPIFKDYDFEGSNLSTLLDIITHNTYLNLFYLNMSNNEWFLDSAKLMESVMSNVKDLNYLPRSFRSAVANVDIVISSNDANKTSVVIPKGTSFTSRLGSNNYTFTTDQNIIATKTNSGFRANNVEIFEGPYISETFVMNYSDTNQFILQNFNVDTTSINVTVVEDMGNSVLPYKQATSLFGYDSKSRIFFIQPSGANKYEVIFGDGVIGRKPKDNSTILVEYRISSGELPNGLREFVTDGAIDGETDIEILTNSPASSGAVKESIEEIKYNAPRAFTVQERAVQEDDYETLLKTNFPEINVVSAYGGELEDPPRFGKVMIAVDLKETDGLPLSKISTYKKFLKQRSSLSIDPVFINSAYMYIRVVSNVKYNINLTTLNPNDIKMFALSAVMDYSNKNLDDFKTVMRYSRLTRAIDDSHDSIISNETEVYAIKHVSPLFNRPQNIDIKFDLPLYIRAAITTDNHTIEGDSIISSNIFYLDGETCQLEDNGNGIVRIMAIQNDKHVFVKNVGTVNYDTGLIQLINFGLNSIEGSNVLKVYAKPRSNDIYSNKNVILAILEEDVIVNVQQVRE